MSSTPPPHSHASTARSGGPPPATQPTSARDDHTDDGPIVVDVRGLRCRYGDFEAVRGIDLQVRRGQLFALLGTNGAGKTTALETLEGYREADEGQLRVLGLDPHIDRRRLAARIGVMLQTSGLPGDLTPRESLALWTRLTPDAAHHLDVDAVLARVDIAHRADVRIRHLSGGERRRLDLGLALVNAPELVFLDEPTTGMDPEARFRTWQIIRDLLAEGVTVVLTTHYLEEAEALADRLAIMHGGRLATAGTLAEVIGAHPAQIHAQLPPATPALPTLDGQASVDATGRLTVSTRQLQRDLTSLLRWAEQHAVVLGDLQAAEASLAPVFHEISSAGPPVHAHNQTTGDHR